MKIPLQDALGQVLHSLNTVSRRPIYEKYDKNVQGNTVWERGQTLVSMTACFRDFPELDDAHSRIGVAIGTGGNTNYAKIDPQYAAEQAICEGALKTAAVGGHWLGATDCLNFGNPEKSAQMGQFVAGIEGVKVACETLNIPIVSGNVSLYNESSGTSIPPSALVSVFARVESVEKVPKLRFTETGTKLFFIGKMADDLGGSEFLKVMGKSDARLPEIDYDFLQRQSDILRQLVDASLLKTANIVSTGGVWKALCESAFSSQKAHFSLQLPSDVSVPGALFGESMGVLVATDDASALQSIAGNMAIPLGTIGMSTAPSEITHGGEVLWSGEIWDWNKAWEDRLRTVI